MDIVLPDLEKVHRLSELNLARCESPVGFSAKLYDLSMLEWANAMMGEAGEASNKIHKYNEIIKGRRPGRAHSLISSIADEIADTVIYLDIVMQSALLAAAFNFDLWTAICDKWNHTSAKILYTRARLH